MLKVKIYLYLDPKLIDAVKRIMRKQSFCFETKPDIQQSNGPPVRLLSKNTVCVELLDGEKLVKDLENYLKAGKSECFLNDLSLSVGGLATEFSMAIGLASGHRNWVSLETSPGGLYHLREHFDPLNPSVEPFPAKGICIDFR